MTSPAFTFTVSFVTKGAATGKDLVGNDTFAPSTQLVPGCMFAPGNSIEDVQGRQQVVDQPTIYAPTGTSVGAPDSVVVPGYGSFEVDGRPQAWPAHPRTGWQPSNSVVIKLKAVTG